MKYNQSHDRKLFWLLIVVELSLLAILNQFEKCFFSGIEFKYFSVFFLLCYPAPCLKIEELLIYYPKFFIDFIVIIPFLVEPFSLSFKVLLSNFCFFSSGPLLPMNVLLWNLSILFQLLFILLLRLRYLAFDVILSASPQIFQLSFNFGPLKFLLMPFNSKLSS